MNIGGKDFEVKENLQLIKERNAHHIGELGKSLLKWIEADEPDAKELEKMEARWKKICGEIFAKPEGIPPIAQLGIVGVNSVAQDFFAYASITKPSGS